MSNPNIPQSTAQQAPQPAYYQPAPVRAGTGCLRPALIAGSVIVGLFLGLLILGGILASTDEPGKGSAVVRSDEPASIESSVSTPVPPASGGQDVYAIGETAHSGDFDVTVHAVQDPYTSTNQFETPQAGQRFVAVEATVTNTSDEPLPFSTLVGVELIDQMDRAYSIAMAGTDLPQLDSMTVAPGAARRGWVVFDAPPDATELRIRIKGNLTATGSLFQL